MSKIMCKPENARSHGGGKANETAPRPRKQRPLPPKVQRFSFLKAIAHFEGAWEHCRHGKCRDRRQCTGGPRGTCATTGVPLCRQNAPAEWWAGLRPSLDKASPWP